MSVSRTVEFWFADEEYKRSLPDSLIGCHGKRTTILCVHGNGHVPDSGVYSRAESEAKSAELLEGDTSQSSESSNHFDDPTMAEPPEGQASAAAGSSSAAGGSQEDEELRKHAWGDIPIHRACRLVQAAELVVRRVESLFVLAEDLLYLRNTLLHLSSLTWKTTLQSLLSAKSRREGNLPPRVPLVFMASPYSEKGQLGDELLDSEIQLAGDTERHSATAVPSGGLQPELPQGLTQPERPHPSRMATPHELHDSGPEWASAPPAARCAPPVSLASFSLKDEVHARIVSSGGQSLAGLTGEPQSSLRSVDRSGTPLSVLISFLIPSATKVTCCFFALSSDMN